MFVMNQKRVFVRSHLNFCTDLFFQCMFYLAVFVLPAPRYSPFSGLAPESLLAAILLGIGLVRFKGLR